LLHLAPALSQEADQQAMLFCKHIWNSIILSGIVLEKREQSWQSKQTTDLFLKGQNRFLSKEIWVRTMSIQRHFNEWPISELHGEVDSIQTSFKLLFNLQQQCNVVSVFQLSVDLIPLVCHSSLGPVKFFSKREICLEVVSRDGNHKE
jgi:hypothetical protein